MSLIDVEVVLTLRAVAYVRARTADGVRARTTGRTQRTASK